MLSEEEIIEKLNSIVKVHNDYLKDVKKETINEKEIQAIQGLLDLYNKEKEKNKKYQGIENGTTIIYKAKAKYVREDRIEKYYISKDKIREKLENLKDKEQEMTDGQGYWGGTGLQAQIEILEELLGKEE